jgi:hypothetical protein
MPKFVRFTPTYNPARSVWVNPDNVTHVQAEGDVEGSPTCFIGNASNGGVFVIGSAAEVVEKLEDARRG